MSYWAKRQIGPQAQSVFAWKPISWKCKWYPKRRGLLIIVQSASGYVVLDLPIYSVGGFVVAVAAPSGWQTRALIRKKSCSWSRVFVCVFSAQTNNAVPIIPPCDWILRISEFRQRHSKRSLNNILRWFYNMLLTSNISSFRKTRRRAERNLV